MIVDRINALLARIHQPPMSIHEATRTGYLDDNNSFHTITRSPLHDKLDVIDRHVGIITRSMPNNEPAPVVDRVRRLERRLDDQQCPPYFWLGAQSTEAALP